MKRFTFLTVVWMLVAALAAGCSGGASKEGDSGVVELEMWIHDAGNKEENEFYKKRIEEFNQTYKGKIHVNLEVIPRGGGGTGYDDRVNAALQTGELPDVLDLDGPNVAAYAESGIIAPIDSYLSPEDKKDFLDSIIQQGTYKGKLYHLGAMESSVVLYYNKKIFEDAGIKAPTTIEEAWTWDQLYQVAKKLTTKDQYGLDLHMDYGVNEWLTYMGTPLVWSNGGQIISEDGKKVEGYLNGPETVEALEFVKKLFEEKIVKLSPKGTEFEEGKAAMVLGGPWIAKGLEKYPELEWGMMPYPYSKEPKSPSGSWGYSITTQTEHPKEAFEVVKWMTNLDSTVGLSKVTGMPPARKSAFDQLPHFNKLPYKVMMDQLMQTAQARPRTPVYPVLSQKFAEAFHAAALGKDPKTALDQAAKHVERELRRFR